MHFIRRVEIDISTRRYVENHTYVVRAHTYELHLLQYSTYLREKTHIYVMTISHRCDAFLRRVHVVGVHVGVHVGVFVE